MSAKLSLLQWCGLRSLRVIIPAPLPNVPYSRLVDNVLPAVLRKMGVLELSPALATVIDEKQVLKDGKPLLPFLSFF